MINKNILTLILFLLFLVTIFGCTKKQETQQPTTKTKVIGVSLLNRAHIFYRDLEEGLKSEAAKHGYELIITSGDFDLGKQMSQIEDFITRKVDAIVLCPVDSRGVGPAVRKANEAKIPVFTADIAAEEGEVVSHIASDNVAGGRLAGEYLAKYLNGKGNVAIINQPIVTSVLDRVKGFMEAITHYPDIKVVADVNGDGVRDRAMQAAADILQANPKLDGIFGINDDSALGALDAATQFNRMNIAIVGYDAIDPARDAIKKGTPLKADVIQYPKIIGSTTIAKIAEYFGGATIPKLVPVEVGIVDKDALMKESAQ
ncbi:MAG: substrate-binding domain-containing protein [Ignavibacteriae bacterium]|nr:substrate-binding domain-containing protein [Ignavibacteriota bacterium]